MGYFSAMKTLRYEWKICSEERDKSNFRVSFFISGYKVGNLGTKNGFFVL